MDDVRQRNLSRLSDSPLWVETRDLMLREGSTLLENPTRNGFVAWNAKLGLGSVVGDPEPHALALAAGYVSELIAFGDNIERVVALLPEFEAELATVFSAPEQLPFVPPRRCREINLNEIAALAHLPDDLVAELSGVAEDGVILVAAFDGALPVAFSYVAAETESLWDVSIGTVPSHRRQGYAASAVLHLMCIMRKKGKSAVWGALQSNPASASLARRLGFVENDRLWVLTRSSS